MIRKNYKEIDLQKKRGNETGRGIERSIDRGRQRERGFLGFPSSSPYNFL